MTEPLQSFNLIDRPWIVAQSLDGTVAEVSLLELFERSHELRAIAGDLPTQTFALTRLALAVLHRAVYGPQDAEQWAELWRRPTLPVEEIAGYLGEYRDRFDLLHAETPFFQVADLHTARDEAFGLQRLIADVPNGEPFFTTRIAEGLAHLLYPEAARWLVHCQAYDPSGIKSGAVGDPRVTGGKGYPIGVAWTGNLGGILLEGPTLRETLLLNLVTWAFTDSVSGEGDTPVWERDPHDEREEIAAGRAPLGPVDLYTWQSRRVRLHSLDGQIVAVLIANGDKLTPQNQHTTEPGTGWRRSQAQEKKLGKPLVYMPREHAPERAMWRGLASLLPSAIGERQRNEGAKAIAPRVLEWAGQLRELGLIPHHYVVRVRAIGAVYGSQQSVIDEVIDDELTMDIALLQETNRALGALAADAATDADAAAQALAQLASNLARAAGGDGDGPAAAARSTAFSELDHAFRAWLTTLTPETDLTSARAQWHTQAKRIIRHLGHNLIEESGPAAWIGRQIGKQTDKQTDRHQINTPLAELWFAHRLREAFPLADSSAKTQEVIA